MSAWAGTATLSHIVKTSLRQWSARPLALQDTPVLTVASSIRFERLHLLYIVNNCTLAAGACVTADRQRTNLAIPV